MALDYSDPRVCAYLEKILIIKMNKAKDPKVYAEYLGMVCKLREGRYIKS